jgi:hypothetical protein
MHRPRILGALVVIAAVLGASSHMLVSAKPPPAELDPWEPTPGAECGPGSNPEETQGRVPLADHESGRAAEGYTCNAELVAHHGDSGGYRVHRYVDAQGHECAFYDTTLLFPLNALGTDPTGVFVLDMSDPANPVRTATLSTPAMQSPHESMSLNQERGLLAAGMGYPTFQPGFVDIYDVSQDCRHPVLQSSLPVGILGHEGEFSPDGRTFWVSSIATATITAVDVTNPATPSIVAVTTNWNIHGLNISDDGTRFYGADNGSNPDRSGTDGSAGLTILDVSDVQNRVPNPEIRLVNHLTWQTVSIPQTAIPVTITSGHPPRPRKYVVEVDEFGGGDAVGAARIVNIEDEHNPFVVSNLRLEVNSPEAQAGEQQDDPGASSGLQGYDAHYCAVPQRDEPGIVACSFIVSGLRVFDIRDPHRPLEIAYFNQPPAPGARGNYSGSYAMSAPTFVPERGEIWHSDGNSGFYNVRITNGMWPFGQRGRKPTQA